MKRCFVSSRLQLVERPTAAAPSLTMSEPFSAKNAATLSGFWLHHAAAYRRAKSVTFSLLVTC